MLLVAQGKVPDLAAQVRYLALLPGGAGGLLCQFQRCARKNQLQMQAIRYRRACQAADARMPS